MFSWKKQQVIIFVVAVVLVADFIILGFLPLRARVKAVNRARSAQRLVIAKAAAEQRQLPDLQKRLQQLESVVCDYQTSVPAGRDLGSFLQQIANLMGQHNLTEQVVAPGEEIKADQSAVRPADKLSCIPVNVQCKGRLSQIFEFCRQLQRLDRLVRIESVRMVNDGDFSGRVSMQTRAVVYYRPNVEPG
jgi:Tfp pilus assembly protein PilO